MNAQAEILPLPVAEPSAAAGPTSDLGQSDIAGPVPPADASQSRRNGKITHLPKAQRDLINHLLDEGVTYETILRTLAEQGVTLNLRIISDWFHGGYQDELQARERRALLIRSQERLLNLARKEDAPDLSFVGLQLAVTQLAQQLYDIAPGSHKETFQDDTHQYLRMLNTLARMSKAMLALQQHHDAAAKAQAPQLAVKNPDRDLNDNEYGGIVNKMDQVFKVRRRRTPSASPAAPKSDEGGSPPLSNPSSQPLSPTSPAAGSAAASPARTMPAGATVGPLPPAGESATASPARTNLQPATPAPSPFPPPVTRRPSPSPERCHECNSLLPPLLSSGERPSPHCNKCGTSLRPPGALIEYCPKCRRVLQELNANGTRPTPECLYCNKLLPPPPKTAPVANPVADPPGLAA